MKKNRTVKIKFGAKCGTVEVSFGQTSVLCVVSGEVVVPAKERPNEGKISFFVEYGPLASPQFEIGKKSAAAGITSNLIERLLKGSRAIDTEALCIVGGSKVWSIRVDIRALDDHGNLTDACAVAALIGLMHFRREATVRDGKDATVFSQEDREPVPLSIHHIPVPVTFALFEDNFVPDPTLEEEEAASGLLTVCVNQHGDLCGIHKPGGLPCHFDLIKQCVDLAVENAKEMTALIQKEIEADKKVRDEAKRNVHQKYNSNDVVAVDFEDAPRVQQAPRIALSFNLAKTESIQEEEPAPAKVEIVTPMEEEVLPKVVEPVPVRKIASPKRDIVMANDDDDLCSAVIKKKKKSKR